MTDEENIACYSASKRSDFLTFQENRLERIDITLFDDAEEAGVYDEPGYLPAASVRLVTWEAIRGAILPGDEWWRYDSGHSFGLVLMRGNLAVARIIKGALCY